MCSVADLHGRSTWGSLFQLRPIFNFERCAWSQKNSISDKNNANYAANGYIDARAADAN
jgi:hypothetical protein